MNKQIIAKELLKLAKQLVSMEFDTQEALDKYMKEHPEGDRSNHSVKKQESAPSKSNVKIAPRSAPMTHPEHWVAYHTKEMGTELAEGRYGKDVELESNEDQLIRNGNKAIDSMKKAGHDTSTEGLNSLSQSYGLRAQKTKAKIDKLVNDASQKMGKKVESLSDLSAEDRNTYQKLGFDYKADLASASGIQWINGNRSKLSM